MTLGRQWDSRLRIWDNAFLGQFYQPVGEIAVQGFTTMSQLSLTQAKEETYCDFPVGEKWGKKWEYGWFRGCVTLPESVAGQRIVMTLGVAPEMLVFVNGKEAGSIDKQHFYITLTDCAQAGAVYEIYAEGYAGHGPREEGAGIWARDSVPVPEPPAYQCTIKESTFGVWNQQMFLAYADYHTLYELWKKLPENNLRGMKIGEALQEFTYKADFELPEPERTESIVAARAILKPLLEKKNGDTAVNYTVFGQSHLDLAWLWTAEETKRKSARTYSNQLALMERYPEYRFLLCSPTVLENLKEYYPDLYIASNDNMEKAYLAGLAMEISDEDRVISLQNFPESAMHAVTYQQKILGYPFYYETSALLYNMTYLEELAKKEIQEELGVVTEEAEKETEEEEEDTNEEDVDSIYLSDNGNIVAVTYGGKDGNDNEAYKTFILNYNSFSVEVVFEGTTYTIPAFSLVVIYR